MSAEGIGVVSFEELNGPPDLILHPLTSRLSRCPKFKIAVDVVDRLAGKESPAEM